MVIPANNNKKMSLGDARYELEQRGFKIVVDPTDTIIINVENGNENNINNNNNNCNALVGYHSECTSITSYKMDTIVFVFQIKNGESLTLNRINDDLENYIVQKQYEIYDSMNGLSNTCPPRGWTSIIVVYYTNTVDTDAMEKVMSVPEWKWGNITFLAVQDENCVSSFMVHTTPLRGPRLYFELRYWAGLLTGRPQQFDILPGRLTFATRLCIDVWCLIMVLNAFDSDHMIFKLVIAVYIIVFLTMWLYRQHQRRQRRTSINNNCNERNPRQERLL